MTLTFSPVSLNICSTSAVPLSISVPDSSAVEQLAEDLLLFQYLT